MPFIDAYPVGLNDEGNPVDAARADTAIYRYITKRLAVPDLPDEVRVGEATIYLTTGPVRTQQTQRRQRPGLPFVFDKHMQRGVVVGENDPLTVCQLTHEPPRDFARSVAEWRDSAETALGFLAATLDDRLVGEKLAEDIVLLADGEAVAAADVHLNVRTYMPFDVTGEDRQALGQLRAATLSLDDDVARAANFYGLATAEGPTRHGVLLLWLAVDAIVGTRKTQKQAVASRLASIGFDLAWLNLDLGRLVGLRGNIAHGRVEDSELLRQGYYDAEAIARALIRSEAGIAGGWPAMPSATAFRPPLGSKLAEQEGQWEEVWHSKGLPEPDPAPPPTGLPRVDAVRGGHSEWLQVIGAPDEEATQRLWFWAMAAIRAIDVDLPSLTAEVVDEADLPRETDMAVNDEQIRVSLALAVPSNDLEEARLAYFMCRGIAEMHVMRIGILSEGFGAFLIELAGAWAAYREWVINNEMPREVLSQQQLAEASLQDLGAYVGAALAGDERSRNDIADWLKDDAVDRDLRDLVGDTMAHLASADHFSDLLSFVEAVAQGAQEEERPADS